MDVLVVSGTGTEMGKTVVTAAVAAAAAAAGRRVAVLKAAQTGVLGGEPGDAEEVARLAGGVTTGELARFPEPLAPNTAARRAGLAAVRPGDVAVAVRKLAVEHDLVLVEGAGGLLVHLDDDAGTLADVAAELGAPVLVVAAAGLGTLNAVALTTEVLRGRGVSPLGTVIGSWPAHPDLACRCNLADLPVVGRAPLLGSVPAGAGALAPEAFRSAAPGWLAGELFGTWDGEAFLGEHGPPPGPAPRRG
ncbi:dethiobiotin synthetase [Wenjunlia vitaminophila]|uniref:ATP-dependent dethiobiotin synthetase BioD n=1 Tax=Wenjunlia vitaminophila TaxID=76728 RepID=A0A0T6LUL8_WENVI|nr:dethiobiotin synthase [Wenjunlia vitaminophila]KRV49787.1 dethiobiotin synthetase [Wenjunlia vitaminophila]